MRNTALPVATTALDDAVLVVPFDGLVDTDNERDTEAGLLSVLDRAAARLVVVHVRSRIVTPHALRILLRASTRTSTRGGVLSVAAPFPVARRVLHLTGLARPLRLAATVTGAVHRSSAGCAHLGTAPGRAARRHGTRRSPASPPAVNRRRRPGGTTTPW
ncbi:STAS domain-containing protein [Streptomyces sp. SPB074]|uniref:STAS domain-containing protein n=1 Tax=Streptomyces sp. (strain SPB074) TaxID=465543 RepID=UPI00017F1442|nr:anti-anti-sigma factor [Streptomyces sp. SPB074]